MRTAAEFSDAMLWLLEHFPEVLPKLLIYWRDFLSLAIANAASSGLALPLLQAMIAAAALCSFAASLHIIAVGFARGRATVFISYEHGQESVAELITKYLKNRSIGSNMLPFVDAPDHDELLDDVRNSIDRSDLILCIPGPRPSFVDNEIAIAFGAKKPMVFVLSESDTRFLPNTAKKGYPLFDRDEIEADGCKTLADFCSYVAADVRSTFKLYLSVLDSLRGCALTAAVIYIVMLALLPNVIPLNSSIFFKLAFVIGISLFLVAYSAFFLNRYLVRTQVKNAIARRRFDSRTLPKALQFSLRREDLLRIQFKGEIAAMHEGSASHLPSLVIQTNLGRPILYLVGIYIAGPGFLALLWLATHNVNPDNFWTSHFGFLFIVLAFFNLLGFIGSIELFSVLFQRDMVLDADGVNLGNAKCPQIRWGNVESVVWSEGSDKVGLNIYDQKEPTEIDLEFYNIDPDKFVDLVQEGLSRTPHPILAQLPRVDLSARS